MREIIQEIWSSIRKNKLRTFLTGFSVAWGILMLIILLGAGNGLQNGMKSNFDNMATNSIELYSNWTTLPYGGYDKGRRIRLTNNDLNIIKNEFPYVDKIAANAWFFYAGNVFTYNKEFISLSMTGVTADYTAIHGVDITRGRFINEQDNRDRRKVVVIEESTVEVLFGKEDPIGKTIVSSGVAYSVVGVYKPNNMFGNQQRCFIPLNTGQMIYLANDPYVGRVTFTLVGINSDALMDKFEKDLIRRLAAEHNFSPDDQGAIWLSNNFEQFKSFDTVFGVMSMVLWIIGLGTLLAGIVGVSNIMLVTVRERTFEFGIRKALGAKPSSIIRLILVESVIITAFFGYMGMVLGVAIMEGLNFFVEQAAAASTESFSMFLNPTVNLDVAISATIVLIIAGLIAGYVPARRAAQLKTIDAMRHNK